MNNVWKRAALELIILWWIFFVKQAFKKYWMNISTRLCHKINDKLSFYIRGVNKGTSTKCKILLCPQNYFLYNVCSIKYLFIAKDLYLPTKTLDAGIYKNIVWRGTPLKKKSVAEKVALKHFTDKKTFLCSGE